MTLWLAAAVASLRDYGLLAPLVQLLLATLFGFIFAERWQRWRQRRDFQYRTLVKFSELSYEMMDRLSELLMSRLSPVVVAGGRVLPDRYHEKHREMVARWTLFVSMRGEVIAFFGRDLLLAQKYQRMYDALNTLREYLRTPEPVPQERFEPVQETFLAYREAIVADMIRAMGLISRRHYRAEQSVSQKRLKAVNGSTSGTVAPPETH